MVVEVDVTRGRYRVIESIGGFVAAAILTWLMDNFLSIILLYGSIDVFRHLREDRRCVYDFTAKSFVIKP